MSCPRCLFEARESVFRPSMLGEAYRARPAEASEPGGIPDQQLQLVELLPEGDQSPPLSIWCCGVCSGLFAKPVLVNPFKKTEPAAAG